MAERGFEPKPSTSGSCRCLPELPPFVTLTWDLNIMDVSGIRDIYLTGLPSCFLSLLRLPPQPLPRQPERKVMVMPAQNSVWCFLGLFIWWGCFSRGRASSKWTPSFWIYGLPCPQWKNWLSLCFENDSNLNYSSNCWIVVQYIMRDLIREGKL